MKTAKPAPIKDTKAAALIAEASDLVRQRESIDRRVDEIKNVLRAKADAAVAKRPDPNDRTMVQFDSDAGVASVIFASEIPRLATGSDPEGLMARYPSVGADWDRVFRKRILLASEWQEALVTFPKDAQRAVKRLVEWEPSTPRVVIPK